MTGGGGLVACLVGARGVGSVLRGTGRFWRQRRRLRRGHLCGSGSLAGLAGLVRGPDWMVWGDSFAHDTRCAGVGNWAISRPISAMMIWAARSAMPGTSSRRSTVVDRRAWGSWSMGTALGSGGVVLSLWLGRSGSVATSCSIRAVSRSILSMQTSIWSRSSWARSAWWSSKRPLSASINAARFALRRPQARSARIFGSRWPAMSVFDHRPRRHSEQVRGHRRQLDQGVFEELLDALLVPGTFLDHLDVAACSRVAHRSPGAARNWAAACPAR